jgi:hypothetical protein
MWKHLPRISFNQISLLKIQEVKVTSVRLLEKRSFKITEEKVEAWSVVYTMLR